MSMQLQSKVFVSRIHLTIASMKFLTILLHYYSLVLKGYYNYLKL